MIPTLLAPLKEGMSTRGRPPPQEVLPPLSVVSRTLRTRQTCQVRCTVWKSLTPLLCLRARQVKCCHNFGLSSLHSASYFASNSDFPSVFSFAFSSAFPSSSPSASPTATWTVSFCLTVDPCFYVSMPFPEILPIFF